MQLLFLHAADLFALACREVDHAKHGLHVAGSKLALAAKARFAASSGSTAAGVALHSRQPHPISAFLERARMSIGDL